MHGCTVSQLSESCVFVNPFLVPVTQSLKTFGRIPKCGDCGSPGTQVSGI